MDLMIVEDEEMIQQLYRDILSMRGYNILGMARDGEEALEMFRGFERKPDLIIMDHRIPGISGLDAAQEILQEEPATRIIVVSADENAVWEALKLGMFGIRKPFNITELINAIETSIPRKIRKNKKQERRSIPDSISGSGLFMVDETEGENGLEIFRTLMENGYTGMCFTRNHPSGVMDMPVMKGIPVVWFTTTPVKEFTYISPMNIQKMLVMIESHASEGNRTAFFVWGFEYLLTNLTFDRILNLVQVMNDRVMNRTDMKIIFSMDLAVLDDRQRKLFLKEFKIVE